MQLLGAYRKSSISSVISQDPSSLVRQSFLEKIHKLLREHAIPSRYACAFALAASDCIGEVRQFSTYLSCCFGFFWGFVLFHLQEAFVTECCLLLSSVCQSSLQNTWLSLSRITVKRLRSARIMKCGFQQKQWKAVLSMLWFSWSMFLLTIQTFLLTIVRMKMLMLCFAGTIPVLAQLLIIWSLVIRICTLSFF